ncbi:hypothetical protein V6N13_020669 [Hibiscus sabdariffa]
MRRHNTIEHGGRMSRARGSAALQVIFDRGDKTDIDPPVQPFELLSATATDSESSSRHLGKKFIFLLSPCLPAVYCRGLIAQADNCSQVISLPRKRWRFYQKDDYRPAKGKLDQGMGLVVESNERELRNSTEYGLVMVQWRHYWI